MSKLIRIFVNGFGLEAYAVDPEKLFVITVCVSQEELKLAKMSIPLDKLEMKLAIEKHRESLEGKNILGYLREEKRGLLTIKGYWVENGYTPARIPLPDAKRLKALGFSKEKV